MSGTDAALAILGGCRGDSQQPEHLEPTGLRIISGDNQVAQVVTGTTGSGSAPAATPAPGVDVLADTLIVRLVGDTVSASMSPISGPSFFMAAQGPLGIEIPAGASVLYETDLDGCGASFLSSATPDSTGDAKTLWEIPGSRAGLTGVLPTSRLGWWMVNGDSLWSAQCHMLAHLRTASGFQADAVFTAYFAPGPAATILLPFFQFYRIGEDDTLRVDAGAIVADQLGNAIPPSILSWDGPIAFAPDTEMVDTLTATLDQASRSTRLVAVQRVGAGWTMTVRCGSATSTMYGKVDSLTMTGTVDSLVATLISKDGFPVRYALWMSDFSQVWSVAGSVRFATMGPGAWVLISQRPGALVLDVVSYTDTLNADGNLPTAFSRAPGTIDDGFAQICGGGAVREMALRAPGG